MKWNKLIVFVSLAALTLSAGCALKNPDSLIPIPKQKIPTTTTLAITGDTIASIQGANHISPLLKQSVSGVWGIVTVVRADGFYMESLQPDDNLATSEGIFVLTEQVPVARPGDEVRVAAEVKEMVPGGVGTDNLSITQLEDPIVEILSRGNALPDPVVVGEGGRIPPDEVIDNDTNGFVNESTPFDPEEDGLDFYESLEGMRIQINDALVVGATNKFKEIVVIGDRGAHASVLTPRGGIVLREEDANPERIILDDRLVELPFVQTGDVASAPIVGVVDYDYGNYKILLTEPVRFISSELSPQGINQSKDNSQLRIANYNVENLSPEEPERIAQLAEQIVNLLLSPDILGLQEIQDNNGAPNADGVAGDLTYQGIIDAIWALGGPAYGYVNIDPKAGNDGGIQGGNIRVGFLYLLDAGLTLAPAPQGDAVTPVKILDQGGLPALSLNPGRIDPTNSAWISSRKPLAVEFQYEGRSLFLINNHFNSKGGDSPLFGDIQPPMLESEPQRLQQASVVAGFVADLLAVDPDARVIVMGDLNDFQFSAPIRLLAGNNLTNLIKTLPIAEQYSYVYEGNSQALDHMLVSDILAEQVADFQILHINSEFDYTRRLSDHDVLMATFALE